MKKSKVVFLTTVFPIVKQYLDDFFISLQKQTYQEFDLVVINDGILNFSNYIDKYKGLNITELKYTSTPAKNREYGINWCIQEGYEILIFGDSDDYFDKNRVETSIKFLDTHDIVVNDLSLIKEGKIYNEKYISNRIKNNSKIDFSFIKDKNIFGLSNTALLIKDIDKISFSKNLLAVDWFFFSLLLLKNKKAVFTNETVTYYRQYESNQIGLGNYFSETCLKKCMKIKKNHYNCLKKISDEFYDKLYRENKKINTDNLKIEYPLWWECNQKINKNEVNK